MKRIVLHIFKYISSKINSLYIFSVSIRNAFLLPIIILFILTIIPTSNFILSIWNSFAQGTPVQGMAIISDILGIISIIITFILAIQKGYSFHSKYSTFIADIKNEIKSIMPHLFKIGIDLENTSILTSISKNIAKAHIESYEKYSDISAFGYAFYKELSRLIAKEYKLNFAKRLFLDFYIFTTKYEYYSKFISEEKSNTKYMVEGSEYYKALSLTAGFYRHEKSDNYDITQNSFPDDTDNKESILKLYNELFHPEKSVLYQSLTREFSPELANNILKYTIKESYTVLSYDNKSRKYTGPVLVLKNEENFESFWEKVNKEARSILKAKKKSPNMDSIEKYNIRNEPTLKSFPKNPFSNALKADPYIYPALNNNPWSPIFIIDCERLPIGYRNNPVNYIEKVVKKEAQNYQRKMFKAINMLFPRLKIRKELVFDYEIIPFTPEHVGIYTRPDKTPLSFQNLLVSDIILHKDKNKFISAKIVQIQSILNYISPFSLIISSVDSILLEKLKAIEYLFLKEIGKKRNGSISWEGVANIVNGNKRVLADILYDTCKQELNMKYFTKARCKGIVNEIATNANIINRELSTKNKGAG